MRRVAIAGLAMLAIASATASKTGAQDIEIRAATAGRQLPAAYYTRIALDPTIFELKDGWRSRMSLAAIQAGMFEGVLPIAVVPTLFSGSAPPPAAVTTAQLQTQLFDGPATSTITGYYQEISRGKLTMRGTVSSWVPTQLTISQVTGTSMGLGAGARVAEWLRQSVAAADAAIDFRQFDNDGPDGQPNSGDDDGRVDGAAFLFHERDASCGGPGIWPHRSRVSGWGGGPAVTADMGANGSPIIVEDYIVLGAMDCSGTRALESNVFAHEMGHVLGLPDYYDASSGILREQRRWVVGCWELMSGGSWGCGRGPQPPMPPPHMGPYPKTILNWMTPTVVGDNVRAQEFTLRPVRTSGDVLRVNLSASEYLLIEYRDRSGFDSGLPAAGVLIYRVQTGRAFLPCATCPRTYSYSLIEADANSGLVRPELEGGNRGEAGDAFLTGASLTRSTAPSTAMNDGSPSPADIHSIVIDPAANVARLSITTAPLPQLGALAVASSIQYAPASAKLGVTGGLAPFTFSVAGLPAGMQWAAVGDSVSFTGIPTAAGNFTVTVSVLDARMATAQRTVALTVAPPLPFGSATLIAALADGGASLSEEERSYLDQQGNRNGRFDIGDVRAYLRRVPK